jgi:hypothetical protein
MRKVGETLKQGSASKKKMKILPNSELTMPSLRIMSFLLPILAFLYFAPHICSASDHCDGIAPNGSAALTSNVGRTGN